MRNELNNIERTERYLNNELNTSERLAFESELSTNKGLSELVTNLKNLQTAIVRSELREKIKANSGGNNNWGTASIIGVLIIAISMLACMFFVTPDSVTETAETTTLMEQITDSFSIGTTDSIATKPIDESSAKQGSVQKVASVVPSEDVDDGSVAKYSLGGHELWTEPEIQTFEFESSQGATIEGKDGMLIIVPDQAFVDAAGLPVDGKVEFNLVEALGVEEMVLYKLHTISNGSQLESGGMFFLEAAIDGNPVQINPERPLYIEIPTTEKKDGMMAFRGEVDKEGNLNWVDPKPLKKYLVKLPLKELDFLPSGFETEVKGNMPFLKYKIASDDLIDSLYYSLAHTNREKELEKEANPESRIISRRDGMDSIRSKDPKKLVELSNSGSIEPKTSKCGIDPISIETIKNSTFANTFIATQEFEERIEALHASSNGNYLLQVYVENLTKDMRVSDSLVALKADAKWKTRFKTFAKQNLTNIKDAEIYQRRLSNYYTKKRKELKIYHKKLAAELASKNFRELKQVTRELSSSNDFNPNRSGGSQKSKSTNQWISPAPRPSAATTRVYATPWFASGWGNIDQYLKLLKKGSVEVPILVSNQVPNAELSQWLTEVNTYTNLSGQKGRYKAIFPKWTSSKNATTHVFSMAESNGEYFWGMKRYNPYSVSEVELEMATASLEDIRKDLRGVDGGYGRVRKQFLWKQEEAKRRMIAEAQARQKRDAWLKKRAEIMARYNKVISKQQEIKDVMNKLIAIAFPCQEDELNTIEEIEILEEQNTSGSFYIVEDMPEYPGGNDALLKFLSDNTQYPDSAKANNISGTTYVSYLVDVNGFVTDIKVVRSSGNSLLDMEALRVIGMLPAHTPGRQRGKAVPVQFTTPVRFVLR